jgi:hypothetical protein
MSNQDEINKAQKDMIERLTKTIRGAAISCFNRIIKEEVVDTGRLRGNWQASVNAPKLSTIEGAEKRTEDVGGNTSKYTLEGALYLTNNLPYAQAIENGHSKRKGSGRVAAAVQETKVKLANKIENL